MSPSAAKSEKRRKVQKKLPRQAVDHEDGDEINLILHPLEDRSGRYDHTDAPRTSESHE
jgi:hypothetical protein